MAIIDVELPKTKRIFQEKVFKTNMCLDIQIDHQILREGSKGVNLYIVSHSLGGYSCIPS